ncbi:hypothetical protein QF015_004172 [Paenarthrobacter sp. TE4293]
MLYVSRSGFRNDRFRLRLDDVGLRSPLLKARLAGGCFFLLVPTKIQNLRLSEISDAQGILSHQGLARPLVRFLRAPHGGESLGVSPEETRAVRERPVHVQLWDLQFGNGSIELLQICTGTRSHHGKLYLARSIKVLGFRGTDHVQGTIRTSEATLAVSHHRQVHIGTADAAVCTEFTQGLTVVARGVGGKAHSFTDNGETPATAACGQGMLEGQLGLNVDQPASHDQVLRNPACTLLLEGLDLVARGAVEFLARNVIVNLGRTFAIRTVGAADVLGVGNAGRTIFPGIATVITVAVTTEGAALTITGRTIIAVTKRLTVAAVIVEGATLIAVTTRAIEIARATLRTIAERPAVAAVVVERTTLTITGRTIAERLTVAAVVIEGATLTITGRTIAERLTVAAVVVEGATLIAVTTRAIEVPRATLRTVAERLAVAAVVVERATLTITGRTIIAITKRPAVAAVVVEGATLTITGRTIIAVTVSTEGTTLTITSRTIIAVTVSTEGTTLTITSRTIVAVTVSTEGTTLTITSRTIAERLTVTAVVVERTTLTITGRTIITVAVLPGTEPPGIPA